MYCDSALATKKVRGTEEKSFICNKCFKIARTSQCYDYHITNTCTPGVTCGVCKTFVAYTKDYATPEAARLNHQCFPKLWCYDCHSCYEEEETNHNCKIQEVQPQLFHANVGFITCEYQEQGETENIIESNASLYTPVIINVLAEQKRGILKKMVFSDLRLNLTKEETVAEPNFFKFEYFSSNSIKLYYEELSKGPKIEDNSDKASYSQTIIMQKLSYITAPNLFRQLFQEILQLEYQAFSFLVENNNLLHCIMSNLMKLDIQPQCVVTNNQYLSVSIPEFNISFLNIQNYLPYEIHDLMSLYELDEEYPIFPQQSLNQEQFHITTQPPFEQYLHWRDTEKITTLKKNSYKTLSKQELEEPFSLGKALLSYSNKRLSIFAHCLFTFLQSLFVIQENLITYFDKTPPRKGLPFFSPFTAPCYTLASFNYTIFHYFGLQHSIYALKNEFGNSTCTDGELEYVLYHTYKLGEYRCYSLYTPKGLKRFKNYSIPNIATDTWAGWFMNCKVQGHLNNCLICPNANVGTKNIYGDTYGDLNAAFCEKMRRISNEFPEIVKRDITWECEWNQLREKNTEIAHFVKKNAEEAHVYSRCS